MGQSTESAWLYEPLHVICLWALGHSTRSGSAPEAIVRNHASNKIQIVSHEYLQAQTMYPCALAMYSCVHMSYMWPWIQMGNSALWARAQNLALHYGAHYIIIDHKAESPELHLKACCILKRKSKTKIVYV
jgi:hypothetical protein